MQSGPLKAFSNTESDFKPFQCYVKVNEVFRTHVELMGLEYECFLVLSPTKYKTDHMVEELKFATENDIVLLY